MVVKSVPDWQLECQGNSVVQNVYFSHCWKKKLWHCWWLRTVASVGVIPFKKVLMIGFLRSSNVDLGSLPYHVCCSWLPIHPTYMSFQNVLTTYPFLSWWYGIQVYAHYFSFIGRTIVFSGNRTSEGGDFLHTPLISLGFFFCVYWRMFFFMNTTKSNS